jgi:hypothetical protein
MLYEALVDMVARNFKTDSSHSSNVPEQNTLQTIGQNLRF